MSKNVYMGAASSLSAIAKVLTFFEWVNERDERDERDGRKREEGRKREREK